MNIKTLLTVCALAVSANIFAQDVIQEPDGTVNAIPGELKLESATLTGNTIFAQDGSGIAIGSSAEYPISVAEAGNYVLYLTTGDKVKNDNGIGYDIYVNDVKQVELKDNKNYGGNWNVFIVYPLELTLPAGESTVKIVTTSNRCNLSDQVNPTIAKRDQATVIDGTNEVSLPLTQQHITSPSTNYVTYSAFGADNSGFGPADHKSVLMTDMEFETGSKTQSPFQATQLRYVVTVSEDGTYPVTLVGNFTPAREKDDNKNFVFTGYDIEDYSIKFTAVELDGSASDDLGSVTFPTVKITDDNSNLIDGVIVEPLQTNGLGGVTKDYTAEGTVNLKAGTYYVELSASYGFEEYLSLKSLTFGTKSGGINTGISCTKVVNSEQTIYSLSGVQLRSAKKGINLVKTANGVKKIIK